MAGPLQVAAHPIQPGGASRQHRGSVLQHPEVLAASALAGIDNQAPAAKGDTAERSGHYSGLAPGQDEGTQVYVARLQATFDEAGRT